MFQHFLLFLLLVTTSTTSTTVVHCCLTASDDQSTNHQDGGGARAKDLISSLPGQPEGVEFAQYGGYITVDEEAGRSLFYYLVESQLNSCTKPLILWLNGGPGCSSLGAGAFLELGPFRVNRDGLTLSLNTHSWNTEANILFLESPAGVGFSYSNTTADYEKSSDERTASDAYAFLVNWLDRFPEYKSRPFFLTGESYAGHYVPQLAQLILCNSNPIFNFKGIAIGNALVDYETNNKGMYHYFWSHALISDEIYHGIVSNCNFSTPEARSETCNKYIGQADSAKGGIYDYDIYAPNCNTTYSKKNQASIGLDPCIEDYVESYLNNRDVQNALHANVTSIPRPWESCNSYLLGAWKDRDQSVLPVIKQLMGSGITVWLYRYAIDKLQTAVQTPWYPWYSEDEVGGYVVGYQNLTFVTVRGAGHFVPGYQPARALALISSFLNGSLPQPST